MLLQLKPCPAIVASPNPCSPEAAPVGQDGALRCTPGPSDVSQEDRHPTSGSNAPAQPLQHPSGEKLDIY